MYCTTPLTPLLMDLIALEFGISFAFGCAIAWHRRLDTLSRCHIVVTRSSTAPFTLRRRAQIFDLRKRFTIVTSFCAIVYRPFCRTQGHRPTSGLGHSVRELLATPKSTHLEEIRAIRPLAPKIWMSSSTIVFVSFLSMATLVRLQNSS